MTFRKSTFDSMNDDSLKQIYELLDQLLDLGPEQRGQKLSHMQQEQHPLYEQIKEYLENESSEDSNRLVNDRVQEKQSVLSWLLPRVGKQTFDARASDLRELAGRFEWDPVKRRFMIGSYQIGKCLSFNTQTATYFAHDQSLDRNVVLILPYLRMISSPEERVRYTSSAKIISSVFHPNVATILGVIEQPSKDGKPGLLGVVRQWIAGEDLATWLSLYPELTLPTIAAITQRITEGLAAIHAKHALHGDINPSNIVIRKDSLIPVITDFGTVFTMRSEANENSRWLGGTPGYIAPEVLRNSPYDSRIDIYSLGIVLRDLLKHAESASRKTEAFQQLQSLSDRLAHEDPDQRPKSCEDIIPELSLISGQAATNLSDDFLQNRIARKNRQAKVSRRLVLLTASTVLPFFGMRERNYFLGPKRPSLPFVPGTPHDSVAVIKLTDDVAKANYINVDESVANSLGVLNLLQSNPRIGLITIPPNQKQFEYTPKPFSLPNMRITANISTLFLYFYALPGEVSCELLARNRSYSSKWYLQSKRSNYIGGPTRRNLFASVQAELLKPGTVLEFLIRLSVEHAWNGEGRAPIMFQAEPLSDGSFDIMNTIMWTSEF